MWLFLDKRKEEIRSNFEKIDEENKKIINEKSMLSKEEINIKKKGNKIIEEYREKAMEERNNLMTKIKDEIEILRERSKKNLEDEKFIVQKNMKSMSMELSTEICKEVLKDVLDEESQRKIIDSFISGLEKIDV